MLYTIKIDYNRIKCEHLINGIGGMLLWYRRNNMLLLKSNCASCLAA